MPKDFSISLGAKGGTDRQLLHPPTERVQSMRGFEDTYVDIIDYIVRITHRIWEQKDIGYIYETYKHSSRVYDDSGLQYGRDKIVADTVHTINAFPDYHASNDNVIVQGDWIAATGFVTGTHQGEWLGVPPTGRPMKMRFSDFWLVRDGFLVENWVMVDDIDVMRQLGVDLLAMVDKA